MLNTSNTTPSREAAVFGDPLDAIWRRCVFDLCGVKDVRRRTFSVVVTSTPEQRRAWLGEVAELNPSSLPQHGSVSCGGRLTDPSWGHSRTRTS